jgi:hypothetical protein
MKTNIQNAIPGILLTAIFCGCTTYYISTSGLNDQLAKIDTNSLHQVYDFRLGVIGVVAGGEHFYNAIKEVQVEDKNGNKITLNITPHTGVRITDKNGDHKIVYFDTMFVKDSLLYGNKSHFVNIPIEPFHLRDIAKLEIQE